MIGGNTMTNGYYFDISRWDINQEGRGREVHPLVALLITPFMGLAFLMFLPFIGFYLSIAALFKFTGVVFHKIFSPMAAVPGEAHLTGHGGEQNVTGDELVEIEREIDSRRG